MPVFGKHDEEMVTVSDTKVTWLTQDAYDRLKHELDELIDNRPVIAAKINDSREEGDLKENGGYHAAREEQGQQEARIRHLQELLRTAKVGEAPPNDGRAEPGMVLTIRYDGDDEDEQFLLATREEGAEGDLEVFSPDSPLGKALLGASEGEIREYELPNGSKQKVKLITAVPYSG
jgi:transcription elongation factor GreA